MSDWQHSQQQNGAVIENGVIAHFGSVQAEIKAIASQTVMSDLDCYRLVRLSGTDAESFLHGQLSNDLQALTENDSQLSSYNSPKGRVLALFRVYRHDGSLYLRMPTDITDITLKRLQMFIMRSDVQVEITSLRCLGMSGENASALIGSALSIQPPTVDNACVHGEDFSVCRLPGSVERFELYLSPERAAVLWNQLDQEIPVAGQAGWEWLNIQQGQPEITTPTREAFVAQMLNLEPLNAISFTKGCYPGQEVVARMHYLGNLKRRMYRLHTDEEASASQPGDEIYTQSEQGNSSTGKVVSIQPAPSGGYDLLAVLQIDSAESDRPLSLDEAGKSVLTREELPYSFAATSRKQNS